VGRAEPSTTARAKAPGLRCVQGYALAARAARQARCGVRVSVVNWQRAGVADVDGRNRQARAEELKEGEALGVLVLTEVEADGGDKVVSSPLPCLCATARMGQGTGLVQGRAMMCVRLLASGREAAVRGRGGQLAACTTLRHEAVFHGMKSTGVGRSWWSGEGEHGEQRGQRGSPWGLGR